MADDRDERLPIDARASVIVLAAQLEALQTLIGSIEKRIKMQHRSNEASQRVETIPGVGVLGATAIVATVADPTIFRSGRDFAAWIGLVPRQDSTGGKQKLGPISKLGRSLFAAHYGTSIGPFYRQTAWPLALDGEPGNEPQWRL